MTAATPAATVRFVFTPEQYGGDPTGATDATAAIQAALNDAALVKGTVQLAGRYLQGSGNITQPQAVAVTGCEANFPGASWADRDYSTTGSTVIQNPSYTWNVGNDCRLARLTYQREGLAAPTSFRTLVSATTSFAGTAITFTGSDVALDDILTLGHAVGVETNGQARFNLHRVNIDAQNGMNINAMYDISTIDTVEIYPYTTYNTAWANATWPVTALTTDGSGQVVVTIGTPTVASATLLTGDTINAYGFTGLPGISNRYPITVSGNQVTLVGSKLNPTTTGTLLTTSTQVEVASAANVGAGQAVSGTGISGGTTVVNVNLLADIVTLSAAPTTAGTGVSLTFTSPSYTSGGSVKFKEIRRTGDGITITNAQGLRVLNPFVLGHDVAYHAGTGADGTLFVNAQSDNDVSVQDPNTIAYLQDGAGSISIFIGGFLNSHAYPVVLNGSGFVETTTFTGVTLASANFSYTVWASYGRISLVGSPYSAPGQKIYVGDGVSGITLSGNDWWGSPVIEYQSPADAYLVSIDGFVRAPAAPTTGTWAAGDQVRNSAPTEQGTTGSKYVVTGWVCVASGTPGTWLAMRALDGN